MSFHPVPLTRLSLVYRRSEDRRLQRMDAFRRRLALWGGGLSIMALLYFGVPAFWNWKHAISSSGGRYFLQSVSLPVPAFGQDDPRWTFDLLGDTTDTLGQEGCAVTSAAMVLAAYGVDTDPQRLNQYLTTHSGYTDNGYIYWEKAAEVAPYGQVEKAYEDLPSYALIDQPLLSGNPVIVRLTLPRGEMHFVVIVGKQGWNYLIRDPARPSGGIYPLRDLTDHIEALRFYRILPPTPPDLTASLTSPASSQSP